MDESQYLVTVPSALIAQWRTELLFKFGLIEGANENDNYIMLVSVEKLNRSLVGSNWDFLVVDEVHNYLNNTEFYEKDEEDATQYYFDMMTRKKENGGKYNEKFLDYMPLEAEFDENEDE